MKQGNELSLYDMSGNVYEWYEDDYHDSYNNAPKNGSAWVDNPRGSFRVCCGDGWTKMAGDCRVTFRYGRFFHEWPYAIDFRLAHSL